jgi:hypothetical protein
MAASHLGIILTPFVLELHARGYTFAVIQRYVETVEHFGLWLRHRGISIRQINERCFRQFLCNHLPRCRCPKPAPKIMENCRPALGRLCDFLRERKLIPPAKPESVRYRPLDQLIVAYDQHMNQVCGLSVSTRRTRQCYARQLLQWRFGRRRICLQQLVPKDLVGFVTSRVPELTSGSSQALVVGLRSFLRFLELSGRIHALPFSRQRVIGCDTSTPVRPGQTKGLSSAPRA